MNLKLNFSKGYNRISDEGIGYLADALSTCECLERVDLNFSGENNEITDEGEKKFDSIKKKIDIFNLSI